MPQFFDPSWGDALALLRGDERLDALTDGRLFRFYDDRDNPGPTRV